MSNITKQALGILFLNLCLMVATLNGANIIGLQIALLFGTLVWLATIISKSYGW